MVAADYRFRRFDAAGGGGSEDLPEHYREPIQISRRKVQNMQFVQWIIDGMTDFNLSSLFEDNFMLWGYIWDGIVLQNLKRLKRLFLMFFFLLLNVKYFGGAKVGFAHWIQFLISEKLYLTF